MAEAQIIFFMIILPAVMALLIGLIPKRHYAVQALLLLLTVITDFICSIAIFGEDFISITPWAGFGINFALRVDGLSSFILLVAACFGILFGLYAVAFLRKKPFAKLFYFYYLLTVTMVNGSVLADNLVMLLFFWEGLLVVLFGMIMLGGKQKFPTAVKALVLNGLAVLSLMLGGAITSYLSGTMIISDITAIPIDSSVAVLGFVTIMLGAIGMAGSMPFHTWISDAAIDAPLPFMALLPAVMSKLLGIYLLVRIFLDLFVIVPGSSMSLLVMIIGAVTIVLAAAMAIIQTDFKSLLAYVMAGQVGYMLLGIGTALPAGIIGGLFYLINFAVSMGGLFLIAGVVEKQTGTTNLKELGGLGRKLPLTGLCFIVLAAVAVGVPLIFSSKELIYDAVLQIGNGWGIVFYIAALLGTFLTAAAFLKLGHTVYFGKYHAPQGNKVKEAAGAMLLPIVILALTCIIFGVYNPLPLRELVQPSLGAALSGEDFAGLPHNWVLVLISLVVLGLAVLHHYYGLKKNGSAEKVLNHIQNAPGLNCIYDCAEKHYFDPYNIITVIVNAFSWASYGIDRAINWVYDVLFVKIHYGISMLMSEMNDGSSSRYLVWSFSGLVVVVCIFAALF